MDGHHPEQGDPSGDVDADDPVGWWWRPVGMRSRWSRAPSSAVHDVVEGLAVATRSRAGGSAAGRLLPAGDEQDDALGAVDRPASRAAPRRRGPRPRRVRADAGSAARVSTASRRACSLTATIAPLVRRTGARTASPMAGRSTAMPSATVAAGSRSAGAGGFVPPGSHQRLAVLGLHPDQTRSPGGQLAADEFAEALVERDQGRPVADRRDHHVRYGPAELLPHLEGDGLLRSRVSGLAPVLRSSQPKRAAALRERSTAAAYPCGTRNTQAPACAMSASLSGWHPVETKMTARTPAAAAPMAEEIAAFPVEAVVMVSSPRRRPSSRTSAVARSLLEALGLRVSSLTHSLGNAGDRPQHRHRQQRCASHRQRVPHRTVVERQQRGVPPHRERLQRRRSEPAGPNNAGPNASRAPS